MTDEQTEKIAEIICLVYSNLKSSNLRLKDLVTEHSFGIFKFLYDLNVESLEKIDELDRLFGEVYHDERRSSKK